MTSESDSGPVADRQIVRHTKRPSLLSRILSRLSNTPSGVLKVPTSDPIAVSVNTRIAWQEQPFRLTLGSVCLEFHPDLPVTGEFKDANQEWIVHPGRAFYDAVPKFVRIKSGETILLGRANDLHARIFGFDGSIADRHAMITNSKGDLVIQPLETERSTSISTIEEPVAAWMTRRRNLLRLPEVLGCPWGSLESEQALALIQEVNAIVDKEAYRELDDEGRPGGIIQFPSDMTVVIMGDVHARADNLLRVISEGGMLSALEGNQVCLVLLGDLVHSQEEGELEDMDSSVFILDLFCMLKRRFPKNVFYVHGNHESFSVDVGKGGVPQGILFRKHLKKLRGKAYANAVESLFDGLAFVVLGNGFAACHGAPVRSKVDRDVLVNICRYPGIQSEIVWGRLRQGNRPAGYWKGSVKRFRRTLNLPKHAPLIVGHTPQSSDETLWLDVNGITGHHIVYSAHTHRLAAIVMSDGQMTPLEFVPEAAVEFLENLDN